MTWSRASPPARSVSTTARAGRPSLWFDDDKGDDQRFHVEVYVAPEVREQRIAAVLAADGTVADGSETPGLTVVSDEDGNTGILCVDTSAVQQGGPAEGRGRSLRAQSPRTSPAEAGAAAGRVVES